MGDERLRRNGPQRDANSDSHFFREHDFDHRGAKRHPDLAGDERDLGHDHGDGGNVDADGHVKFERVGNGEGFA